MGAESADQAREKGSTDVLGPNTAADVEGSVGAEDDPGAYLTGLRLLCVVTALVLAILLTSLDFTIIATAIPRITDDFIVLEISPDMGRLSSWSLPAFKQLVWGKAYGFFSLKVTFLLALFIFEIGSLICGVAPSSVALIVGRAIAGLGAAGLNTGSFTLVAFCAPPSKRPIFTGIIVLSYGIASVVGPLLGGVFTDSNPEASKSDDTSSLVLKCSVSIPSYGGQTYPWSNSIVIGLIVGFVSILAVLVGWELYLGERAMSAPRLVKRHTVPSAVGFFFFGSYIVIIYYLPTYFQSINGVSPIGSGVRNLPFILAVSIFTLVSGISISATGYPASFVIGGAALGTIGCGTIYMFDIDTSTGKWIGYQIIAGVGNEIGVQVPMIMAQANTPPVDMAATTAILMLPNNRRRLMQAGAQAAFANCLLIELPNTAPEVDPAAVLAAGATELEGFGDSLDGVRIAYMRGLKVAFAFACASMGVAFLLSLLARKAWVARGGAAVAAA
ncbi:major facilitator superfamily domain-containing protein [Aspergillus venezuelensis]